MSRSTRTLSGTRRTPCPSWLRTTNKIISVKNSRLALHESVWEDKAENFQGNFGSVTMERPMDIPVDRQLASELLATNRKLVAVNTQIAGSLANLERLYAGEIERNAEQRVRLAAMTARMGGPTGAWGFYLTLLVPLAAVAIIMFR
jgi:hypothetical protein